MKRYSVSYAYGRDKDGNVKFHYFARTDDVENTIKEYHNRYIAWCKNICDEEYEFRGVTNDYHGIRITDSKSKDVVFEESHISEELGWKKEYKEVDGQFGKYLSPFWVRI